MEADWLKGGRQEDDRTVMSVGTDSDSVGNW